MGASGITFEMIRSFDRQTAQQGYSVTEQLKTYGCDGCRVVRRISSAILGLMERGNGERRLILAARAASAQPRQRSAFSGNRGSELGRLVSPFCWPNGTKALGSTDQASAVQASWGSSTNEDSRNGKRLTNQADLEPTHLTYVLSRSIEQRHSQVSHLFC